MKNITNLPKDTACTPASQETDSEYVLSLQDMQLIELVSGFYYYIQQESLSDQDDKNYTVPIEKIQQFELASYAVLHAFDREKAVISLDPAFFDKLKDIYTQAYILYMNGIDKKVKHRECEYLKKLYLRSTEAAKRLHTAWHAMEESKNALQHSGSGGKALIESIWSCSCITITLAKFLCDNANNIERYIRNSGAEGRAWYEALKSMEEESEEMHDE